MDLTLPGFLVAISEWIRPRRRLSRLRPTPPAVADRFLSSTGLKSLRTLLYGSRNTRWPTSRCLDYVRCRPTLLPGETNNEGLSEAGNVSPHSIPCVMSFSFNERYNGWKMSAEKAFIAALNVTSELYETMRKKWQSAEDTIEQLRMTLQRRNNQVRELGGIIHELHMTTSQHQRQIELQKNQLEEQEGMLLEMYVALQMRGSGPHSLVAQELGMRLKHTSREYWLLRKHRTNLVKVTKPIIQSVIQLSSAAGLVSISIGACALNCSSQDYDCTDEFYKALQVTVSERPEAFTQFLEILRDNAESPLCQQLCQKIQKEVTPM